MPEMVKIVGVVGPPERWAGVVGLSGRRGGVVGLSGRQGGGVGAGCLWAQGSRAGGAGRWVGPPGRAWGRWRL